MQTYFQGFFILDHNDPRQTFIIDVTFDTDIMIQTVMRCKKIVFRIYNLTKPILWLGLVVVNSLLGNKSPL